MLRRPPRSTRTDPLSPYTTLFRAALDENEICIGLVEILRHHAVRGRFDFAHIGVEVDLRIGRLWVHFRIAGDFQGEVLAMGLANELDQLIGIAKFAGCGILIDVAGRSPRSATMRFTPAAS